MKFAVFLPPWNVANLMAVAGDLHQNSVKIFRLTPIFHQVKMIGSDWDMGDTETGPATGVITIQRKCRKEVSLETLFQSYESIDKSDAFLITID